MDMLRDFIMAHGWELLIWWLLPALAINVLVGMIKQVVGKLKWTLRLAAVVTPMMVSVPLCLILDGCNPLAALGRGAGIGLLAVFCYDAHVYPSLVRIMGACLDQLLRDRGNQRGFVLPGVAGWLLGGVGAVVLLASLVVWVQSMRTEIATLEADVVTLTANQTVLEDALATERAEVEQAHAMAEAMADARRDCLASFERYRQEIRKDAEIMAKADTIGVADAGVVDNATSDKVLGRLADYLHARVVRGQGRAD